LRISLSLILLSFHTPQPFWCHLGECHSQGSLLTQSMEIGRCWQQHGAGYVEVAVQNVGACAEKWISEIRLSIDSELDLSRSKIKNTTVFLGI
jgi:hypothetical protein